MELDGNTSEHIKRHHIESEQSGLANNITPRSHGISLDIYGREEKIQKSEDILNSVTKPLCISNY
jgi:hypothetical protein